jgi:hypothetical protein
LPEYLHDANGKYIGGPLKINLINKEYVSLENTKFGEMVRIFNVFPISSWWFGNT